MSLFSIRNFLNTRLGILLAVIFITATPFLFLFLIPGEAGNIAVFLSTTALLFCYAWLKGTGLSEFGLQKPNSWKRTLFLGILYAVVAFLLFRITLEPLLERWTGVARDMSRFDYLRNNTGAFLQFLVVIWITAAFFEELYFRGFLVTSIAGILNRSWAGWILAVLLSATFFALAHSYQAISGILYTGLAAIYLSVVFLAHGRNLWIPMIAHGLHDSSGVLFTYLGIYNKVVHLLF